jgi:excisionase family DNA binding protein
MAIDPNEVRTIEELSTYRKVSKSTLYKLAQEGSLPAQKVGKHWRSTKELSRNGSGGKRGTGR